MLLDEESEPCKRKRTKRFGLKVENFVTSLKGV
jgi:hypothetical protein